METCVTGNKVPAIQKFGYLCSGLSYSVCMLIPTFLIYYATESLAISVGSVSIMMMLVKILDGVTDIFAGMMIDRTKSKKGKARPWFLWISVPYAMCLVLMFCIPESLGTTAKLLLLALFYALTVSVFGTVIGVARLALVPRMTDDPKERGMLGVLGDGISAVVVGVGMALTLNLVGVFGWTGTFGMYAVIVLVTALLCYFLTREKTEEINEQMMKERESVGFSNFITAIFKNKYALLIFLYVLVLEIGCGSITAGGTYYFQYVYGDLNAFTIVMLVVVLATVAGVLIGSVLVKKIGTRKIFLAGCIGTCISYVALLINNAKSLPVILVFLPLCALFGQTFTTSQFSALASAAVDYSEYKNGVRNEGITSSVVNIGIKIGTAAATGILGLIMNLGGYVEGGVEQTARAIQSINIAYILVPFIAYGALAIFFGVTYKLEKLQPEIQAALAEKRREEV